jgi:hypothetical protein
MGVRSCISILMNLVLALTFLQAPFQHVHEHESTEQHPHGFFHTHYSHHHLSASKLLEVRGLDPDDDAVFQQWFSATIKDLVTPAFTLTIVYTVALTWSSEPFIEPNILSGHDPPCLFSAAPRSPPV